MNSMFALNQMLKDIDMFNSVFAALPSAPVAEGTSQDLPLSDLVLAERFLHGDDCADPVMAHQVVKAIHAAGNHQYPSLWPRADRYVRGYEFNTMERLAHLPSVDTSCHPSL